MPETYRGYETRVKKSMGNKVHPKLQGVPHLGWKICLKMAALNNFFQNLFTEAHFEQIFQPRG